MFTLDGCKGYISAQTLRSHHLGPPELPAIAISREAGTDARQIARLAAERLNASDPHARCPWAAFDQELVKMVIQDHGLAEQIRRFMPEDATNDLKDAVEEMLGLHPSQWKLVHYTTDVVLRLAHAGHAIIIGRAATEITARMPNVLRIHLVAPVAKRVAHLAETLNLSQAEAADRVHKLDRARYRYVSRNFNGKVGDPLHYHLTLNTGLMTYEEAARVIVETLAVLKPAPKEE